MFDSYLSLGTALRQARLDLYMSVRKIAASTGVREEYIEQFEFGDLSEVYGNIYLENYLRAHVEFLGFSWKGVQSFLSKQRKGKRTFSPQFVRPREECAASEFWVTARIAKFVGIIVVALGCFGYLGWLGYHVVLPPQLVVSSPSDNIISTEDSVVIEGRTVVDAQLTINGQVVAKNRDGEFSQEVRLVDGVNILEIVASRKYSQEKVLYRKIIFSSERQGASLDKEFTNL